MVHNTKNSKLHGCQSCFNRSSHDERMTRVGRTRGKMWHVFTYTRVTLKMQFWQTEKLPSPVRQSSLEQWLSVRKHGCHRHFIHSVNNDCLFMSIVFRKMSSAQWFIHGSQLYYAVARRYTIIAWTTVLSLFTTSLVSHFTSWLKSWVGIMNIYNHCFMANNFMIVSWLSLWFIHGWHRWYITVTTTISRHFRPCSEWAHHMTRFGNY